MIKPLTQLLKNKEILIYSFVMAVLLFSFKWLETHFIIYNYRLDIFIGTIATVFTVLGIWLALKLVKPKVKIQVIEKEIIVPQRSAPHINHQAIENSGISKRELEVLNLMALGLSNDEIAEKLFVSLNTVKTHSSSIFLKLDVKRRTQAISKAKQLNIIE